MLRDTSPGDGARRWPTPSSPWPRTPACGSRSSTRPAADPLLRLAHHVALTDFAATYLALGFGFDPADSPHVRLLRGAARRTDAEPTEGVMPRRSALPARAA